MDWLANLDRKTYTTSDHEMFIYFVGARLKINNSSWTS